jgi:hypothetical protein
LLPAGIAFGVALLVAAWALSPYLVGVFHDDGVYALLAQSIASGHGFHYSNLPGHPAAIHYPPLYPLLLSVFWRIWPNFPANVSALVLTNAPLIGFAAIGWWYLATRRAEMRTWIAAGLAVLCTVMMPTLALASALLSETLFLALLWPALALSERAADASHDVRRQFVAGIAIGVLMLVRTHAIAMLAALLVALAMDRRWRDAVVAFVGAVVVQLPWLVWTSNATPRVAQPLEGSYGSYLGWYVAGIREGGAAFVTSTMRTNIRESYLFLNDRLAAGFPTPVQWLVTIVAIIAFGTGCLSLARRARVTVGFVVMYLAIVLLWPYTPWRFIWAVWPLLMLVSLSGVRELWSMAGRMRPIVVVATMLPVLALLRVELHAYATRGWRAPAREASRQFAPVMDWVRTNLPPGDVILSEGEQMLALYDGRTAAPPVSFTASQYVAPRSVARGAEQLSEMMRAVPAQWVIVTDAGMIRAAELLRGRPSGLEREVQLPSAVVYRVAP